jgi:hypothetical protein
MKKLFIIPVVLLLLSVFALPVYASDPSDIEVDIGIVTPGDANINLDVNAGGDANVVVDGVDFKDVAGIAQSAYNIATAPKPPTNFMWDYTYYWERTGLKEYYDSQLAQLGGISELLLVAQAKLIDDNGDNAATVSQLLEVLNEASVDISNLEGYVATLQAQDEKTWNQLMYGAEAHISILEDVAKQQKVRIDDQESQIEILSQQLVQANQNIDVLYQNNLGLSNYTGYLRVQYMYYFCIMGGCIAVLLGAVIWLAIAKRGKKDY